MIEVEDESGYSGLSGYRGLMILRFFQNQKEKLTLLNGARLKLLPHLKAIPENVPLYSEKTLPENSDLTVICPLSKEQGFQEGAGPLFSK